MARPGPKPMPDNVVRLTGGSDKTHRPLPESIKTETEIPTCPSWLSSMAKTKWKEITKELARYDLISTLDKDALTIYCDTYGTFRQMCEEIQRLTGIDTSTEEGEKKYGVIQLTPGNYKTVSAYWIVRNRSVEQMLKIGEQFGLTPSARVRVNPINPDQGNLNFD